MTNPKLLVNLWQKLLKMIPPFSQLMEPLPNMLLQENTKKFINLLYWNLYHLIRPTYTPIIIIYYYLYNFVQFGYYNILCLQNLDCWTFNIGGIKTKVVEFLKLWISSTTYLFFHFWHLITTIVGVQFLGKVIRCKSKTIDVSVSRIGPQILENIRLYLYIYSISTNVFFLHIFSSVFWDMPILFVYKWNITKK